MSLAMIRGEFGGGTPINASQYFAGGPHVPAGTAGINGPVPSGGALPFSKFYGTTAFVSFTQTVTSTQDISAPTGAHSLTVRVIGFGGGGGGSYVDSGSDSYGAGGGGGGAGRAVGTYAISAGNVVHCVINFANVRSFGPGFDLNCPPGGGGFSGGPGSGGGGGNPSTGTGGNVSNDTGGAGGNGNGGSSSGAVGGAGGASYDGFGQGGAGADAPGPPAYPAQPGAVIITWFP
jgi:hypothetical protein